MMIQPSEVELAQTKEASKKGRKYLGMIEDYSFLMLDEMSTPSSHHQPHSESHSGDS
jgi:hypothetical protein